MPEVVPPSQGEYSNYQTMRKAKTYINVWDRIKRDARNAGVLNTRALPNGDFIDSFGTYMKKSSCEPYYLAA